MGSSVEDFWIAPLRDLAADVVALAPRLLAALIVLAIGLLLAWVVRRITAGLMKLLKLDAKLHDLWIFRVWIRGLQGRQPSSAASNFAFYAVLFVAVLLAIRMLGVEVGQTVLATLLGVVPRVLSFMLILFLGGLLAMFFSALAQLALAGSGAQHPNIWGKVIAWGTFGVTVVFSLEPLGLAGELVTRIVLIAVAVAGAAAALAFGLGCKDLARELVIELLKQGGEEGEAETKERD
jgi:hypothetical protein